MTEKLDMTTPDMVTQNIERIAALFPNCVTEVSAVSRSATPSGAPTTTRKIDFDLLRQELSHDIVEGPKERYRLEWPGKREAIVTANMPTTNTLRPVREDSVNFDTTENLYIEGDNLEVLKLLQESYLGKVKMIYIDPPYNTGNDFVYRDNFAQNTEEFKADSGMTDELGNRLVANPETAGRYHSDWLTMMYPRLKLARNLLTDDGAIFISIDDNEVHNIRKMCDEVFGEVNFVAALIWEKGRKNDSRFFSQGHEYIIVYVKDQEFLRGVNAKWREEKPGAKEIYNEYLRLKGLCENDLKEIKRGLKKFYSDLPNGHPSKKHSRYSNVDERGVWRDDNMSLPRGGARYQVIHPKTGEPCAIPPGGWRYATVEIMHEKIKEGVVVFREDHTEPPIRKTYLVRDTQSDDDELEDSEDENGDIGSQVAGTYFYRSGLQATNLLRELLGKSKIFNNPKDHEVISRFINYTTSKDKSAVILDFFAGSATTAHAVMQLNAEDGGNRKFIMVQLPEKTDEKSEAYKAGYQNICEIGKERIRRAGEKICLNHDSKRLNDSGDLFNQDNQTNQKNQSLDVGFRVYRLDTSNMQDVYYRPQDYRQDMMDELFANHIKTDRTPDDLVAQVMLDWGLPLSLPIEKTEIAGKTVYKVDGNALYCCFAEGIDEGFVKALTSPPTPTPHPNPLLEEREQERGAAPSLPLRIVFHDHSFASDTAKENVRQLLKQLSSDTEMKVV